MLNPKRARPSLPLHSLGITMPLLTINHAGRVLPSTDRKRQWDSGGEVLEGDNHSERKGGSPDGFEMKRGSAPNSGGWVVLPSS